MYDFVVLSTPMMLLDGEYNMITITLEDAQHLVKEQPPVNFSGHQTVKLLGLDPSEKRATCDSYKTALVLSPKERLEFGKEYTLEEIEEIGVECKYITFMEEL